MGRIPAERTTKYEIIKRFNQEQEQDQDDPLDHVVYSEEKFGSYNNLIKSGSYRFNELNEVE